MGFKKKKVTLPENSIDIRSYKPTEKLRDQNDSSYELMSKEEFLAAWKEKRPIICNVYGTGYMRHYLHPIILTKNKDGSLSKDRSMTQESFNGYKQFYVDRFKKNQIFKLKSDEQE